MIICHYDGILRGEKEDAVYVGGERRVVLVIVMLLLMVSRVR